MGTLLQDRFRKTWECDYRQPNRWQVLLEQPACWRGSPRISQASAAVLQTLVWMVGDQYRVAPRRFSAADFRRIAEWFKCSKYCGKELAGRSRVDTQAPGTPESVRVLDRCCSVLSCGEVLLA
ncbi:Hypothetical_protein [Hexamita inflata]|uniref:Hypothetical_protein n=1 Tax=Hexamita inflata TaxID=28002 RepID=A0AA86PBP5_9EUKA|nr:Hypothetical protein HINF_LOCUS21415 [Hexamita inflata]